MATDADGLGPAMAGEAIKAKLENVARWTRTCSLSAGRARGVRLAGLLRRG